MRKTIALPEDPKTEFRQIVAGMLASVRAANQRTGLSFDHFLSTVAPAREAVAECQQAFGVFACDQRRARADARWIAGQIPGSPLPFVDACREFHLVPGPMRRAMFAGLDERLVKMLSGGRGYTCPCCGARH